MLKEDRARTLGFRCGLVGALAWFAMGVESILRPFQDNRRETFWPVPFVFTIIALVCVHLLQRGRSRTERLGFAIVMAASALMLVGNIGLQLNVRSLEGLGAPAGPVIWLVGLACFGIGTLQCGVLPRWAGLALILFEPSSILAAFALSPLAPLLPRGAYSGNLGKGIALAIVAFALRHARSCGCQRAQTRRTVADAANGPGGYVGDVPLLLPSCRRRVRRVSGTKDGEPQSISARNSEVGAPTRFRNTSGFRDIDPEEPPRVYQSGPVHSAGWE